MSRFEAVGASVAAGCLLVCGSAQTQTTPRSELSRTDLLRRDLSAGRREAIQVRVDFPKGADAPRHRHAGEELVYVIKGSLEYRLDGRAPVTLHVGDVLFIPNGTAHSVRNIGDDAASELATYIAEKGQPLITLVPQRPGRRP